MGVVCRAVAAVAFGLALTSAAGAPGLASASTATAAGAAGLAATGASATGAAKAPSAPLSGGSEYGVEASPAGVERPLVGLLSVPATSAPGPPPAVKLSIDEPRQARVAVRVTITSLSTRRPVLVVSMGWIQTGSVLSVRWPAGVKLGVGSYHVSLVVHDSHSASLLRRAHSSGVATFTVIAPASAAPALGAPAPTPVGLPTPAQLAAEGAVFPVAGTFSFGGPENRFGAPRDGYTHQGQDVLTSEGTPVLAPLAGVILTTGYQAERAGYYAAEHTSSGFDFFFAHCMAGSLAVFSGERVASGQRLCRAGQTGDATGPHLHFEMWVGGWRTAAGYPIDPLPYLEAIAHSRAGA